MSMNIREFNAVVAGAAADLPAQAVGDTVVKIGFHVLEGCVSRTPVVTGRARGNWQVTMNEPSQTVSLGYDKNGGRTIQAGSDVITGWQPWDTVFITNNVEYVEYLEEGTENLRPRKMLGRTLDEIAAKLGGKDLTFSEV